MAREMCDSKLLVQLSGGVQLVAIEGKYHLTCLTKFCNSYSAFQCAQKDSLSIYNSIQVHLVINSWEDSFVVMFGGLHLEMERRCWDITWPVLDGQLHSLFGVYGCPGNSLGSSQRRGNRALTPVPRIS